MPIYNGIQYHTNLRVDHLKALAKGDVFVETGTHKGDGIVLALDYGFKHIHTVELDDKLYTDACTKFNSYPNVKLYQGSSPDCLKTIITDPSISDKEGTFWLDAHGWKAAPLLEELAVIQTHPIKTHTIFMDDRRLLGTAEWNFLKEDDVLKKVKEINPNYYIIYLDGHVHGDIICAFVEK